MKFTIKSINISEKKGTLKKPVNEVEINNEGIINDAHKGDWHRQISLLAQESIDEFTGKMKQNFNYGDFAENITTEGMSFKNVKLLDILENENIELLITQKGKKCHGGGCTVFELTGNCVMPKEGIFTKVIKPGILKVGDVMELKPKVFKIAVITLSDRASSGEYEDISGPTIENLTTKFFNGIDRLSDIQKIIIPDDSEQLKILIENFSKECDVIFTTGGTGMSEKDITIETVSKLLHKEIPGIMEFIRIKFGERNPKALLSRSIAGSIGKTLVFSMPGSPKAVREYLSVIFSLLEHLIYMVYGFDVH